MRATTAEGLVGGGEEEGEAVSGVAVVEVGDCEGEAGGEGGGGAGAGVGELGRGATEDGAGAGRRHAQLPGEADGATAEEGVADQGKVAEGEGGKVDGEVLLVGDGQQQQEHGQNPKKIGSWTRSHGFLTFVRSSLH